MKKFLATIISSTILLTFVVVPVFTSAAMFNLVPCNGIGGYTPDQQKQVSDQDALARSKAQADYDSPNNKDSVTLYHKYYTFKNDEIAGKYTLSFTPTPAPGQNTVNVYEGTVTVTQDISQDGGVFFHPGDVIHLKYSSYSDERIYMKFQVKRSFEYYYNIYKGDPSKLIVPTNTECNLPAFITLVKNVINAFIIISIPLMTIALTWVGILFLTAQGNTGKIDEAKRILVSVLKGFGFILGAWLLIHTIVTIFLRPEFRQYF